MTIRSKLLSTMMILILISLIVGAIGVFGIFNLSSYLKKITENSVPQAWIADSLKSEIKNVRIHEKEFFLFSELKNDKKRDKYNEKINKNFQNVKKHLKNLEISFAKGDPEAEKRINVIKAKLKMTEETFKIVADDMIGGLSFNDVQDKYVVYRGNIRELVKLLETIMEDVLISVEDISNAAFEVQKKFFMVMLIASGGVILIGMIIGFVVSQRITSSLASLMKGIKAVGQGKVDIDVVVKTRDELGQIANVFNDTMGRLRGYIQTEEERKITQENLMKFLDILGTASDGDFSEKAPVTADVFGSLADAYNLMIDGLTELLIDVRKASNMVGSNSNNLIDIFDRMSQGSEVQMVEVKKASESVDESSNATMNISDRSGHAKQLSAKAAEAAKKGGKMVIHTIEGMQLIRVTVSAINKRMKSLSEKLLEIGSISQLIGDISSRTNMLAMNASIEAARAGEQGKGFVVIAEEIRALADRSATATKDITGIIKAIQTEAGEVTSSLEEETRNVETQTKISTDTGLAFRDIDASIKDSSKIVEEIYGLSQNQRDLTQGVVLAMEEVNRISLQMLKYVDDSKNLTDSLSTTSTTLLNSVSRFKLAEQEVQE
ncbi:MAG: methyl-accepting chemotaxis protein [Thermodesulfovibrionales bacterium]